MKKYIFRLLAFSVFVFSISSCEKKENKDYSEGGTPPVLSASATTVSLESGQEANTAIVLNWTNPDYKFTTGPNTLDVTYTLEMDTLGGNFSSSIKVGTVISKDLTKSYTVNELNSILGNDMQLQLNPRRNYTLQLRVISTIGSALKLTSNVISFTTKPFSPPPKVAPPSSGELYLVGNATPGGWNNPVPVPSQKFTMISTTLFRLASIPMITGNSYLFLPVNGDWGHKFGGVGANNTNNVNGDDFKPEGGDLLAPAVSGNYMIEVDFQKGKFKLTKL
jgi:hypothetical protein